MEVDYSFKVGCWPRHFAISGNFIYVAAQKSNLVQKYLATSEKVVLVSEVPVVTPSIVVVVKN